MLDSLVRVSRRVGKASEAQAPQTGVGHRPRTPGTNSRRVLGTWRKPRSPLAQRRACTQGRTLAQRWSGPTPRIIPSGAGQDIRAPGDLGPRTCVEVPSDRSRALGRTRSPTGRDVLLGGEVHLAAAGPTEPVTPTPTRLAPFGTAGGQRHPWNRNRHRTRGRG